jgi:hypothetical protein
LQKGRDNRTLYENLANDYLAKMNDETLSSEER